MPFRVSKSHVRYLGSNPVRRILSLPCLTQAERAKAAELANGNAERLTSTEAQEQEIAQLKEKLNRKGPIPNPLLYPHL